MSSIILTDYQITPQHRELNTASHESMLWCGRILSRASAFLQNCTERIGVFAYRVLSTLNVTLSNPHSTASILKKIHRNILPWIEQIRNVSGHFAKLSPVLESSVALMNTLRTASDIDYFANSKFKVDRALVIAGKAFLALSHFAEGLLLLARNGFVNMQKFIISLGNTRVFTLASKITANCVIEGSLALSACLFSLNACQQLFQTDNPVKQNYLSIEIAKNTAEFTLALMMMGAGMNIASRGILSCLCIGLEITSIIYKDTYGGNL